MQQAAKEREWTRVCVRVKVSKPERHSKRASKRDREREKQREKVRVKVREKGRVRKKPEWESASQRWAAADESYFSQALWLREKASQKH